jgi:transcription initiation factor TFIID subunit TAF12
MMAVKPGRTKHACTPHRKQQQDVPKSQQQQQQQQQRQHRVGTPCAPHQFVQAQGHAAAAHQPVHPTKRTFQGMMAVKPGRTTTLPVAVNVSPPPASTALVFLSTQSPAAARQARVALQKPACWEGAMQAPSCDSVSRTKAAKAE